MTEANKGLSEEQKAGLAKLREPFPPEQISKLPKPTVSNEEWKKLPKGKCAVCGGYHATSNTIHLDYVGHAALTSRLIDADPGYTWEPFAVDDKGLPLFDAKDGGLWIRLTVCGVTRPGYGHAKMNTYADVGSREKEVIGDALRNAAMRFGAALDLWHKGDVPLFQDEPEGPKEPLTTKDQLRDQAANEYAAELCAQIDLCTTMGKLVAWRKDNADKVNALAPVHKTKVFNYWLEIKRLAEEHAKGGEI